MGLVRQALHRVKVRVVRRLLRGVSVTGLRAGTNTITLAPGGTDVLRWSATQDAIQAGDLGMNTTSGRPSSYIEGQARPLATQEEALVNL